LGSIIRESDQQLEAGPRRITATAPRRPRCPLRRNAARRHGWPRGMGLIASSERNPLMGVKVHFGNPFTTASLHSFLSM
jgi:hypothetical protein